jgi:GNAT superfamily N-acetyltransferase
MNIREISAEMTRPIRRDVLKPGLPESEVYLPGDDDPSAFHLGAYEDVDLIGVASFLPEACPVGGGRGDWRLRGMATIASVRGRGVGGGLLDTGIAEAARRGGARVWCNGRTTARRFYERHGFATVGAEFESPHTGPHFLFILDLTSE